jgi:hypothetical protein
MSEPLWERFVGVGPGGRVACPELRFCSRFYDRNLDTARYADASSTRIAMEGRVSAQSLDSFDWSRITFVKARVLSGLEDQQTEMEIADRGIVALSTIRSHVEDLKGITGCADVRERKWWRENRHLWLAWCAEQAGMKEQYGA